jgi:hypothetical protein
VTPKEKLQEAIKLVKEVTDELDKLPTKVKELLPNADGYFNGNPRIIKLSEAPLTLSRYSRTFDSGYDYYYIKGGYWYGGIEPTSTWGSDEVEKIRIATKDELQSFPNSY